MAVWSASIETERARLPWQCVGRLLAVGLVLLLVSACGAPPRPPPRPAAAAAAPAEDAAAADKELLKGYIVLGPNPKWSPLKKLFGKYNERKIEGLENPMLSHLVDHVEKPVIDNERAPKQKFVATSVEVEEDRPEDHDPRTWMALDRYKLIILMTGSARPKAVIITPNGIRYVLERGDPIGREGGRVKAILQYKMLVAVPKETKPREVSIEPPLARFAEEVAVSKDF